MDMNDPVVIAMMKKCDKQIMDHGSKVENKHEDHQDNHSQEESNDDESHH